MSNARAHAESAIRQFEVLGRKPRYPIDPDKAEALELLRDTFKTAPATKEDIAEIKCRLDAIERSLREPKYIITNAIASSAQAMRRGVFPR